MTLIAEDLLLLLLDDESGRLAWVDDPDALLGGAVLIELAVLGALEVQRGEGRWARSTVHVVQDTPELEDRVLCDALTTVAAKQRSAQDLVGALGKGLRQVLLGRLEEEGILERREDKVLGVFPRRRWPARTSTHEEQVRRSIAAALRPGADVDPRTGALIALLSAAGQAHRLIEVDGLTAKEVRHRAKEIAQGAWAAEAVKDAVEAAQAAMAAVMVAATVATTTGSG